MSFRIELISSMQEIGLSLWQALRGSDEPFLCYEWLDLLEQSKAVSAETGWLPQHLCVFDDNTLLAAMPLYQKSHSLGEYVFDQSWAQAYQHHGLTYYPKLVSCIPFTPVQGTRLLFHAAVDSTSQQHITDHVLQFLQQYCAQHGVSSAHLLFVNQTPLLVQARQQASPWAVRHGCQFHWQNQHYANFDAFLDVCNSKRRKEIRRERRQATSQGLVIKRFSGAEITDALWLACLKCYQLTNLQYNRHFGYLTPDTFSRWRATMAANIVVAAAFQPSDDNGDADDNIVACAIFMQGSTTLYGRYWGALEEHPALHFELCYYQGIEHCIAQGLSYFDPGAQGEHKVPRGFAPITTYSLHYLVQPEFQRAVVDFVQEEALALAEYQAALQQRLPFKQQL